MPGSHDPNELIAEEQLTSDLRCGGTCRADVQTDYDLAEWRCILIALRREVQTHPRGFFSHGRNHTRSEERNEPLVGANVKRPLHG